MMRTFSKLYGLAALRLGWLTAAPGIVDVMNRVRGPFNVATAGPGGRRRRTRGRDARREGPRPQRATGWPGSAREIAKLGLRVHPSLGNFLLVEFPAGAGRDAGCRQRLARGRGHHPARRWAAYGLPHCLRISVGLEDENRRLVEALAGFVGGRAQA